MCARNRAGPMCARPNVCPQHTSPPATAPLVIVGLVSGVFGLERVVMRPHSCGSCARTHAPACERMRMRWQAGASVPPSLIPSHLLLTGWLAATPAAFFLLSILPSSSSPYCTHGVLRLVCCGWLRVMGCALSKRWVGANGRRRVGAILGRPPCAYSDALPCYSDALPSYSPSHAMPCASNT